MTTSWNEVGDTVVGVELLQRGMKLEAFYPAGNQAASFADGFGPARGIDTGERHDDVAVGFGEIGYVVIRDQGEAGETLIDRGRCTQPILRNR